jgi:hypothetical protein
MAWADEVAGLNAAQLAEFGETVTYRQDMTEQAVSVVWIESDGGTAPIKLQAEQSAFAVLPQAKARFIRNGKHYSGASPRMLDGNWLEIDLRLIAPNNA